MNLFESFGFENPVSDHMSKDHEEETERDPRSCIEKLDGSNDFVGGEEENKWDKRHSVTAGVKEEIIELNAEWIERAKDYLFENESDHEDTDRFWTEIENSFKDGDIAIKEQQESFKNKILSRVAAHGLTEDFEKTIAEEKIKFDLEKTRAANEIAKLHAKWIKDAEDYLLENGSDPEDIINFWMEFEDSFENDDGEVNEQLERFKNEVLSRVAARGLMQDFKKTVLENVNLEIEIEPSDPSEEVSDGVHFWVNVERKTYNKRKVLTGVYNKRIPIHVTFVDIKTNSGQLDMRKERFTSENIIDCKCPSNTSFGMLGNGSFRTMIENELKNFHEIKPEGFSICIPIFKDAKAENINNEHPSKGKKRPNNNNTVSPSGKANDNVQKVFINKVEKSDEIYDQFIP
ncbi:MAG: hypothetical protein PHI66_05400 [Candidatus Pacebacteria bacterium]|nr:hypothetical protein [Candidatus Paceibacterota bacterium]